MGLSGTFGVPETGKVKKRTRWGARREREPRFGQKAYPLFLKDENSTVSVYIKTPGSKTRGCKQEIFGLFIRKIPGQGTKKEEKESLWTILE